MLYLIGLGLGDEKDISLRGLEAVKRCENVYLEAYTSILLVEKSKLEALYGREVIVADREMVEQGVESILEQAKTMEVAFLVVGDPFGATTHSDLQMRAKQLGVTVKVIHNASIMNAIGACGLQLYRFGETISIPFFTDTWRPDSFYDKIKKNRDMGLHTLCLLDIRVKEPCFEALARGKKVYEPPRYMSVNTAVEQLLDIEDRRKEGVYGRETTAVGVARIGTDSQCIISGTLEELLTVDYGPPLHSLVVPGELHVMEQELLATFACNESTPRIQKDLIIDEEDEEP
ncbi:hypothetical protein KFL_001210120 [Klebsormidium nitens]|uniref:diphthine methyl ester synthase n=1 Tax=Klebsormidium nitens TaxID=105231 RepID=A0A1Y1I3P3_KLENI|nr:hypothetical protein KFL_001210120 [Klebsormidium nitens]|eukprot:GAQ82718.1 hypothetical protein KFL_001210120 [Klebsormidium nitens]